MAGLPPWAAAGRGGPSGCRTTAASRSGSKTSVPRATPVPSARSAAAECVAALVVGSGGPSVVERGAGVRGGRAAARPRAGGAAAVAAGAGAAELGLRGAGGHRGAPLKTDRLSAALPHPAAQPAGHEGPHIIPLGALSQRQQGLHQQAPDGRPPTRGAGRVVRRSQGAHDPALQRPGGAIAGVQAAKYKRRAAGDEAAAQAAGAPRALWWPWSRRVLRVRGAGRWRRRTRRWRH